MASMRGWLNAAIEPGPVWLRALLAAAILLSIAGAAAATIPDVAGTGVPGRIEAGCSAVFAAEYLSRLWTASLRGQRMTAPILLLDFVGILPLLLIWLAPERTGLILMLQMLRFFRLTRYSRGLQAVAAVFVAERGPLMAALLIGFGLLLIAATGMYLLEGEAQPAKLGSVPQAMYWAIVTLATVGYGDIFPITPGGKIFAGIAAVSGIVFFALPVAIIASGFLEQIRRRDFVVSYGMVARVPMFAGLNAAAVIEVMGMLRASRVQKDAIILRAGDLGEAMYFIAAGQVEVVLPDRTVLLGAGDFFGEAAVLGNTRRNASVLARTTCDLLTLDAADVLRLAGRHPAVGEALRHAADARKP